MYSVTDSVLHSRLEMKAQRNPYSNEEGTYDPNSEGVFREIGTKIDP